IARNGLAASPVSQILVEESILGWKEYELEVMRDLNDNVVIICSIENFDPMGVHTGDSITVAPAQTLTDVEYQRLRDMSIACIRKVGVETGGSNIQFAVNPENGYVRIIEMNPRVSRSSALASKATGFPIAKIAAKLAVGYTLDEIPNDITKKTPASFEPTIDYVVTKIPKWAFEKFPGAEDVLGTQMKSVGEVMAIGRTFKESLFKGLRSLEAVKPLRLQNVPDHELQRKLARPNSQRFSYITYALQNGYSIDEIHRLTKIDPWFLSQLMQVMELQEQIERQVQSEMSHVIYDTGTEIVPMPRPPNTSDTMSAPNLLSRKEKKSGLTRIPVDVLRSSKEFGLSDRRLSFLTGASELEVREYRKALGIAPVYKRVDTCGAEFESFTPYMYSTYEDECEAEATDRRKIMILGSGPNRIGQGIEFDYCCCHASFALRDAGFETIMVNCNPETVSTDYDTSDRLYFEPLTFEDVMNIVEIETPEGVIVQFGGQTPLNLSGQLSAAGVPIIGTSPDSIDLAEDRKRFGALLTELKIPSPANGTATSADEAKAIATKIGYPVVVRPSYVLGGRAMATVYDEPSLDEYMRSAVDASPEKPILVDRFLERATEIDVDALADETAVVIAGIQEHIEEAGIHSGDSSSVLPAQKIAAEHLETIQHYTKLLANALKVKGLMNIQYAIKDDRVYVLEVNPRASRTVPFVAKATGIPIAKIASLVGFDLVATHGTANRLREVGLKCASVFKVNEGRPNIADLIRQGDIALIINTPLGRVSHFDEQAIRKAALQFNVPCVTTITGAEALVEAISAKNSEEKVAVRSLQEIHGTVSNGTEKMTMNSVS
ncbi:MAG: carbamoyl-phosphate synthase large subunit, partial [Acidobacteria bacterium]|nr:carbamoyl-phosphate synthase large subunit [Acidobacteriota bacterium]